MYGLRSLASEQPVSVKRVGSVSVTGRPGNPHTSLRIGRDPELAAIMSALAARGPRALVIEGPAGIGKTTVWRAAIQAAADIGWRVLSVRPREIEAGMPFAALQGLLGECLKDVAYVLPEPQRSALDIALLRASPGDLPVERGVVAAATLSAIRALGEKGALLLAVDDSQWLDAASGEALAFAIRRLTNERIRLLVTSRSEFGVMDLGLDDSDRLRLALPALSPETLREVVRTRYGIPLSISAARSLHTLSGGNPFYALEIARERPDGEYGFDHALTSEEVRGLVGRRFASLPAATVHALATVAAITDPDVDRLLEVLADEADLDAAYALGIVTERERGRIEFTHPLLAAAAYAAVAPRQRRAIHNRLAQLATSDEERARHLALATTRPDPIAASAIEAGAEAAAGRAAVADAARMGEIAARLTPPSDGRTAAARRLAAAKWHVAAGDTTKAVAIWTDLAETCPPGEVHAEALIQLAYNGVVDYDQALAMCDHAVAESITTRGRILRTAIQANVIATSDQQRALALQRSAVAEARAVGDEIALCAVLPQLGLQAALSTPELDGVPLLREAIELARRHPGAVDAYLEPQNLLGVVLLQRNELTEARALLGQHVKTCVARGDDGGAAGVAMHQCEAELRGGNLEGAQTAIDFALSITDNGHPSQNLCMHLAYAALVAAHCGDLQRAPLLIARVKDMAGVIGDPTTACAHQVVAGFWELSLGNHAAAVAWLEPTVTTWRSVGYVEPGSYFFLPDLLEALIAVGRHSDAAREIAGWEASGRRYDRSFPLATGARARGLLHAARGSLAEADLAFGEAITHHQRLDWPHQRARTLFAYGTVLRRSGRRRDARSRLNDAYEIFEGIGETLWSEAAQDEMARLGGRTPVGRKLTDGERRIVELVAAGHSNREVASQLTISTKTVEAVLTRAYAKLQVRSRTELAARWPSATDA